MEQSNMPAVSLYRKWRPQTFNEVVGQEHITTTLLNAIRQNRIAHAYLFTGPRGTGKTTNARLFAKALNCLANEVEARPCNECEICVSITEGRNLDLIEIDAASNNSVDNMRELRERIGFSPSQSRYKVYIIDEVHMLSTGAFNALLKTLEEPPAHAIFILATTEADKLPATILSRCQRFDFRFVSFRQLRDHLAHIAAQEGAAVEAGALDLLARQAGGSMRDGISLLDQMMAFGGGQVTLAQVQQILGSVASQAMRQLADAIIGRDVSGGLNLINQTINDGADPRQFVREALEYLRSLLLLRGSPDGQLLALPTEVILEMKAQAVQLSTAELLAIIKYFSQAVYQLRNALQPQLPIEVAFVESALRGEMQGTGDGGRGSGSVVASSQPTPAASTPPRSAPPSSPINARANTPPPSKAAREGTKPSESNSPSSPIATFHGNSPQQSGPLAGPAISQPPAAVGFDAVTQKWPDVLASIKPQNRQLEAILKSGRIVTVEKDVVVLGFPYPFHKDKIEEPKNKQLLEEVLSQIAQQPLFVRCELASGDAKKPQLRPKDKNQQAMEDPLVREVVTKYSARIAAVEDDAPEG
jgi:DNA polymerase-3 subunit gamma/tau